MEASDGDESVSDNTREPAIENVYALPARLHYGMEKGRYALYMICA
jgi:hypothetical protein